MISKLDSLFDNAEASYLEANDLAALSQYVSSLPERIAAYRLLRDQELGIMQPIADALSQQSQEPEAKVERSVRNGLMVLRYAAMAMLLDSPAFMADRLRGWLPEMVKAHATQTLDQQLFQQLDRQLASRLTPAQVSLLKPALAEAQTLMLGTRETVPDALAGLL